MPVSRESRRSLWFGLSAFLGTFLFIPLWDIFALGYSILVGWRARRDEVRRVEAQAVLAQPVRRLLFLLIAYVLALSGYRLMLGLVGQPGPFGFLATGANNLAEIVRDQSCCATSNAVEPGKPVDTMIAARLPESLRLLFGASIVAMILVTVMVAVAIRLHGPVQRQETLGTVLYSLLRLVAQRLLTPPVAGVGLMALFFLGLRFGWFPLGGAISGDPTLVGRGSLGDRVYHLILPGTVVALLPALIAAQAGMRAWTDWQESGRPAPAGWALLGSEIARAFYEQAGWLLGSLLVVETIFGFPGIGRAVILAIEKKDGPLLVGALAAFPALMLVARLRAALTASAQRAFIFEQPEPSARQAAKAGKQPVAAPERPRPIDKLWLLVAGALLLVVLATILRGFISPVDPFAVDQKAPYYAERSEEHPLGTDHQGRDVQSRIWFAHRVTFGVVLAGGLIALTFGGLWGGLSVLLRRWQGVLGESLADLIRIPADSAILLHPALVALAFTVARFSLPIPTGSGQSLAGISTALGLALTPRLAWAVEKLWKSAPPNRSFRWQLGGSLLMIFTGALFAAFQYIEAISFLNLGVVAPIPSLGNNLAAYRELLAVASLNPGNAHFYSLIATWARAAALQSWMFYVLHDALSDFFGFRSKGFLPRLFS